MVCRDGCYCDASLARVSTLWKGAEVLTSHGGAAGLDGLDSRCRRAVLQDDPQIGEALVYVLKGGQESLLVRAAVGDDTGDFAVDVEDEVVLLHGGEDGVEGIEGCDSGI